LFNDSNTDTIYNGTENTLYNVRAHDTQHIIVKNV